MPESRAVHRRSQYWLICLRRRCITGPLRHHRTIHFHLDTLDPHRAGRGLLPRLRAGEPAETWHRITRLDRWPCRRSCDQGALFKCTRTNDHPPRSICLTNSYDDARGARDYLQRESMQLDSSVRAIYVRVEQTIFASFTVVGVAATVILADRHWGLAFALPWIGVLLAAVALTALNEMFVLAARKSLIDDQIEELSAEGPSRRLGAGRWPPCSLQCQWDAHGRRRGRRGPHRMYRFVHSGLVQV